ncbi:sensor histidine kinase [Arenibacterium sp. CAU 1754]
MAWRTSSLKVRLGVGAAILGLAALAAVAMTIVGMASISARIDASLAAERRIDRYSVLSTQVSTFIVVAAEALQSRLSAEDRADRLRTLDGQITATFEKIRRDHEVSVTEIRELGLDAQSRRATQSIGIARMEALFAATSAGLMGDSDNRERLQGYIDTFALGFDPLLNGAVTGEVRARDAIIASIADLRETLTLWAFGIAVVSLLLVAGFYLGLVRPEFRRLDLLRGAAQKIGREDFAVSLPQDRNDEIGQLFAETNGMANALAARKLQVDEEWAHLNETIAQRTEELRAANEELAKTDENRRRFFADISHELRTPLTVILMEAQLGRAGSAGEADAFGRIENRALRLNRRIDDLLRIARSESGLLELDSETFDLSQAAQDAVVDTQAEVDSAGMTLAFDVPPPIPVLGDRNWMRQVISGLIQNTVRHARSGGAITVRIDCIGDMGCVHITDNGGGIDDQDQINVLERFAQGKSSAKSEGFGIGLALARWVVEQQGGEISITSPVPDAERLGPGIGTKVTVCIPRCKD